MSIITEVVVDDTFRLKGANGIGVNVTDERITLNSGEDFNGTVVFSYDTTDEKGAISAEPALIFFNVRPTRERPDAGNDALTVDEGFSVRFAVQTLLANDFDDDGDAIRITGLGAPAQGELVVELAQANIAPPAGLEAADGAVFTATLADGSDLPDWLAIDAATGAITGDVPLDMLGTLDIVLSRDIGGVVATATLSQSFDGNDGAFATYTPDAAYSGTDGFTYTLTDDREGSSTGNVAITVNPLEDPPVARPDTVTAVEDTPLTIDPATLLANDFDVDGDPIRFLDVANPTHGTVSFDGSHIIYTPDANFSGKAGFEYTVTDDAHGVSTGKVTVNVASTNQAPTPGTDVFATLEDAPFTFAIADLMANDSDPDGDVITFQSIQRNIDGARILELSGGRFQLVPDENVNGPLVFNYTVSDGRKRTTQTITFNVAPVNDAPIANDDFGFETDMDVPLVVNFADIIANDRDVEGDSFSIVEVFDGDQGFVARDGDTAIFTPDGGYFGDAGFHYRVTDEHGDSSVGYVELIVYPDFPLPVASSDAGLEMLEDGYIDIDPAMLMANDTAPEGSTLEFVTLQGATLLDNGKYRYTAEPNFFGEVTLRYAIQNEQQFPVWTTVTIDVLPVDDVPVALDDMLETVEDTPLVVFRDVLLANDSDADPQAIFISGFGEMLGVSVVDLGNGQLEITPDANFNGSAWFDYELSDSTGRTDVARVHVWVEQENDPPVIDLVPIMRGLEDEAFYAALPAGFAIDPDGDILTVSVRGKDGAALPGWLSYDGATRSLSGQPPADFNGTIALEVAANDGEYETVRELIVSIEPVNDAPVMGSGIDDLAGLEDNFFAMALRSDAFEDVDGDALDLTLTMTDGSPAPEWIRFNGSAVEGTPPADFHGSIALLVTASDGELSVSEAFALNIAPVNDAPVLAAPLSEAIYDEDSAIALAIPADSFTDVDGDTLILTATLANGDPLPGWLAFDGEQFAGTPPQDFHGEFALTVTASDGEFSATSSFTLIIAPVNDAPAVLLPLPDLNGQEDTAFSLPLPTAGITDVDGDVLTFALEMADGTPLPDWLTFTGSYLEGTPPAHFNGSIDLRLIASDGEYVTTDSFVLAIDPINDAPLLLGPLANLASDEDAAMSLVLPLGAFTDIDGDVLTFSLLKADGSKLPEWLLFDPASGALTGTPPQNFAGGLDLVLSASDGEQSADASFRLTIDPVNDAPMLLAPLPDVAGLEDTTASFALPANTFADVDGDPLLLSATLVGGLALPDWLTFDGTSFSANPPADFDGSVAITVTASDGELAVSDSFLLRFAAVNDAPVLVAPLADLSSDEDTPFAFTVDAAAFADVDGDALFIAVTLTDGALLPAWLRFEDGQLFGTPPQDFNGTLSLVISASDGEFVASDSFDLSIRAVNDTPLLANWFAAEVHSEEDTAIDLPLPANAFTDVDGDALAITAMLADGDPLPSWLAFDGARFTGTPPQDFNGTLALVVTASDGSESATGAFSLVIDPVNDAPVALLPLPDAESEEDTAIDIIIPAGTFGDMDGDALGLTARLVGGAPLPAWLSFNGESLTGTPPQNYNGELDIEILASDGLLVASESFRLAITPVNDAPAVLLPLADLMTAEDKAIDLPLPTTGFNDVDGDALTFVVEQADGSALPGWLSFDGARISGTPPQDFNGVLSLRMRGSDGELEAVDAFDFTIVAVNDAPVVLTPVPNQSSPEDTAFAYTIPAGTFGDVDGDALTLSAGLAGGYGLPQWLTFDGATLSGTPPQDFNGMLQIEVIANDGLLAATTTFALAIDPVNDAPVLLAPLPDRATAEDTAFSFALPAGTFDDVDGDTVTLSATLAGGAALPGWLAFDGSTFTGTPPQDFNGAFELVVTASDGALSVSDSLTLTITPVNDAPMVSGSMADVTIFGREAIDWLVPADLFSDVDGDLLALSATLADGGALPGWIAFDGNRFSGTAIDDFDGVISFAISASDGEYSASTQFAVTVIDPNDPPLAADDGIFVGVQSQDLTILVSDLLVNDSDPDGDAITLTGISATGAGSVSFDMDGNIVYSVDSTFIGVDTFSYTISDGDESATGTVTVRIDSRFAGWSTGSAGSDKLFGNNKETSQIDGGAGDDHIKGGKEDDWLAGGTGNDKLQGLAGNDHLWGNAGNDELTGNGGFDTAYYFGQRSTYVIQTVSGTVQVVDTAPGVDGDDGTDTIASIEMLSFKNGETASVVSPIILDLSGDGIETVKAADSNARFDLDGDGLADDTSWISADEAFLYLDRDGDGTMSGVGEISFIDDVEGATTDLAGLAAFDSNGDGVLDADDERFGEFGVWRDADGDGAVDEGETASLASVSIVEINLAGTSVDGTTELGEVAVINSGSFTLANGVTREFADAALTYFSAATNLPEIATTNYDFDRKSKKYRLLVSGGAISVVPKKTKRVIDPSAGQLGANTALTFRGKTYGMFAPVVLDLDGDGIELVKRKKSRAMFDYNGDGAADDTGWVDGDDGFLVIDRNNDGLITEASELSLSAEHADARSGLQGLAWLDSNGNGVVNESDARFGELSVWQDRNGNGITDAGELVTLADAGIASINLSATALNFTTKLDRNAVVASASFTRADGTTATAADVSLAYRPAAAPPSYGARSIAPSLGMLRDDAGLGRALATMRNCAGYMGIDPLAIERLREAMGVSINEALDADRDRQRTGSVSPYRKTQPVDLVAHRADALGLAPELGPDVASKLAMIRQDMAAFGAKGMDDTNKMSVTPPDRFDWFMY